jgi:hypothetical protein
MGAPESGRRLVVDRAAAGFLAVVASMVDANPHPHGSELLVTVSGSDGRELGHVSVDVTNLWELGDIAGRRAADPVDREPQRRLHLVRGEAS